MQTVRVILFQHGLGALDYAVPPGMTLAAGQAVSVPLGPRTITGVVWDRDAIAAPEVPIGKLRPVSAVLDLPPIPEPLRRLCDWVSDYYLSPLSAVIRMVWPSVAFLGARAVTQYRLSGTAPARPTPARTQALARLADAQGGIEGSARDLARIAQVSEAVIRGLIAQGALTAITVTADRPPPRPDPDHAPPTLGADQAAAATAMVDAVTAGGFAPFLLEGVTGSGKTEVYCEAVAAALRSDAGGGGGQTLVLLPEIALTAPWFARFAARFGCPPVAWHSDLKPGERRAAWAAVADGSARVVVGARSALFLPFADLRLIIVDEAHETSFKQEEGVHYHARDVAVMRARMEGGTVVLATATPSIETQHQVARGTYRHLLLPARHGGAELPAIAAIDMRRQPPGRGSWLSPPLVAAIDATLARGEQALLFLNRRGYAPLTLCRSCGHKINCPQCSAWMVEHRLSRRLACHHCGHQTPVPPQCSQCGEADTLIACGPGVERIAEEVARRWPAARTALVTSDSVTSPARAAALVAAVEAREVDILIGTQMVTKGYHFPDLTLVGVVDADLGLAGGDLRAGERTFQQIAQVAGRAGRGAKPGRVLIQTHQPQARLMQALVAGDAAAFYAAETDARRDLGLPPFGRLAAIIVSSEDAAAALATARAIAAAAPQRPAGVHDRGAAPDSADQIDVLGPAPAPLAQLRGRHRQRLLVRAPRRLALQQILRDWLAGVTWPASVRVVVDIDPYSFL